ncbi:DUF2730 family protein [Shumkonia mesophila]|uniref:DUF2730 family protein n=1 Tax=Shumkonia mesophila TaxID=2838854 RepID=UPI002934AAA7|nr:DUF2730 family protein [Shumkonia mesophila]
MDFETTRLLISALMLIVSIGSAWFAYRVKQRQADKDEVKELRDRIMRAEARLEETPTSKALHELALSISGFGGDLKAVTARLDGLGKIVERLETVTDRQETYLLTGGGK